MDKAKARTEYWNEDKFWKKYGVGVIALLLIFFTQYFVALILGLFLERTFVIIAGSLIIPIILGKCFKLR